MSEQQLKQDWKKIPLSTAVTRLKLYIEKQPSFERTMVAPRAGVLVGLFENAQGEIHVLLTKRSDNLNSHRGLLYCIAFVFAFVFVSYLLLLLLFIIVYYCLLLFIIVYYCLLLFIIV